MNREALLVLGMHRGGTSAVAGLLVRLGAQGPKTLVPADPDNPSGYWESAVFYQLHERLLRAAGSRWDAFTRLDPDRFRSAMMADLRDECRGALQAEFGEAPRFVLKDPRMCRLVPFWLEILQGERISPAAILVLRSPADVARSLAARNGFERDLSLLIWLRHALDAEYETRAVRRTFVRYPDLLESWPSVAERISQDLQSPWPVRSAVNDAEIDQFVSPRLCHHDGDPDTRGVAPTLSDWARTAWAALERLHDRDGNWAQALTTLDTIRAELDRHTSVLGDVLDRIHEASQHRSAELEREVEALQHELSATQSSAEAQVRSQQARIEALETRLEEVYESKTWRWTAPVRWLIGWLLISRRR